MKKYRKYLISVYRYFMFFAVMSFFITCCMMLFVSTMAQTLDITLTDENISTAAKLTFVNIVFLSALCTAVDGIRRKIMVDRPIKKITEAAERISNGDFSVRLKPVSTLNVGDGFNEMIACFNKIAQELESMETLRTDFISNVSHELKTPLAVISNYGKMLQQPGLSEKEKQEYSKAITLTSRKLADLVSNILKLNKLENQQIFPIFKEYDLSEQLCECLLQFESIWENKNITIDTDIQEDITVKSDPELLSLVWNNLFSNAFKFTDDGGTVKLSVKKDGEFAVVTVTDTGCGIDRDTGKHIFEKFYQGDTSRSVQGNGLGLALVKRVIDITGSEISVDSKVNAGSAFTVKIRRVIGGEI